MDIKIYVCHHKEGLIARNQYFEPIQVGRAISNHVLDGMIGDDTGDNISHKNREWCELTGLYWIWKNTNHDYVGLNHYRRYLNFAGGDRNSTLYIEKKVDITQYLSAGIEETCRQNPIVLSPLVNVHPTSSPGNTMTVYNHYCYNHYKKDLDIALSVIKNKAPEYYEFMIISMNLEMSVFGNIFVMRRDLFNEYCSFLFSVLFSVEEVLDTTHYDDYQKRVYGFLAERFLYAFVLKHKLLEKSNNIIHAGLIIYTDFEPEYNYKQIMAQISSRSVRKVAHPHAEDVHIVVSFDDGYIKQALVSIYSVIKNTSDASRLRFHVLHDEKLSPVTRDFLCNKFKEVKFDFYAIEDDYIFTVYPHNREHINRNTYYRLFMHECLPQSVKRLIYMDLDTLVCDDIIALWNMDMDGKTLAGCNDEGGVSQSRRLFGLNWNKSYINAGVLLFNREQAVRKYKNLRFLYLESFLKNMKNLTLQDQDIINIAYKDDIKILPLRWNVGSRVYSSSELEAAYPKSVAAAAVHNPALIHFTGENKPWKPDAAHPMTELYLAYQAKAFAYQTPQTQSVESVA